MQHADESEEAAGGIEVDLDLILEPLHQKLRSFVVQASACHVEGLDMRRRQAADRVVIAFADLEIIADDTAERHQTQGHGDERPVPGLAGQWEERSEGKGCGSTCL